MARTKLFLWVDPAAGGFRLGGDKPGPLPRRRRLQLGRAVQVYVEPRDAWIGVYAGPDAWYVCPVPFLVVRWQR